MTRFARIAYTDSVRATQRENGSALAAQRQLAEGDRPDPLGPNEAGFIASRDGFYMASVGDTGWPYIQYRGGPRGFLHILDAHTLAFADVRGNRQYISAGNLRQNDRVALFFMDYARQTRLKLLGHATESRPEENPELTARLTEPRTDGRVERLFTIEVEGLNWNCPQHITPRFSEEELQEALQPVRDRMAALEAENKELRARLGAPGTP
ncbi:pyridoxamine 5'-phosphate oxidase family protein [Streptomyces amakusaensis]|uniref:Pyridoxamine 5'-phosphate oxidase family protein n=1 Tax=Streptomyces amakusaensis TaxID=67271 RepID=A0ABW0AP18_9ACTN